MPEYKYRGYDQGGTLAEGIIEADSHKDAASKIKFKGVFPKEITENVPLQKTRLAISKKFSPLVLAAITRRLSILISSGVPLIDAIGSVSSEQKADWRKVLIDLKESLAGGSTLARAMQSYPDIFPDYYTGMISAGESSGKLTEVLDKLADYLENEIKIKNKVKTALIYPIFMACVSVAIVMFLFTFVIPKITKIFEESAASLPFITIILMWISSAFKKFWWLIPFIILGSSVLFRKLKETRKDLIDAVLIKDPTGILNGLYMLRFTMTMGFLLSGGLPILNAMQLTSKAIGNAVLEKNVNKAQGLVTQGAKLSSSLEGFPPTLLQIIATGEQTGRLAEVLQKTAGSYEAEFDRKLSRVIGMLEPSLILIMGLVVGFIVVAVLLPIFELNQMMN